MLPIMLACLLKRQDLQWHCYCIVYSALIGKSSETVVMSRKTALNVKNCPAIVARLRCRRQYWTTRPLLRLCVFVMCFTLYSAFGIGNAFATQSSDRPEATTVVHSVPAQSPQVLLTAALEQWLVTKLKNAGQSGLKYEFALNDKRLSIPACPDFVIDPQNQINASTLTTTLAVPVRCVQPKWQRRVLVRQKFDKAARQSITQARPKVQILTPLQPIAKGERVMPHHVEIKLALAYRTPKNSVSQVNDQSYYAARTLVPGRALVASDLEIGRPVVVLSQALPARSLVTAASLVIEERAVGVPHDAIESLQGLGLLATNRLLHPGDILRKRDLTKAKLVKRGQKVAVESIGRHFRIASDLIALQDGYLGDQIPFQGIGSDRRVFATVTGAGTARSSAKR